MGKRHDRAMWQSEVWLFVQETCSCRLQQDELVGLESEGEPIGYPLQVQQSGEALSWHGEENVGTKCWTVFSNLEGG